MAGVYFLAFSLAGPETPLTARSTSTRTLTHMCSLPLRASRAVSSRLLPLGLVTPKEKLPLRGRLNCKRGGAPWMTAVWKSGLRGHERCVSG